MSLRMKRLLGLGIILVGLTGCGGGSSSNDSYTGEDQTKPIENQELQGFYSGTTSNSQDVGILFKSNGEYWGIYSQLGSRNLTGGFIHGKITTSGEKAASNNLKDFHIFSGSTYTGSVDATVRTKDSLNGSLRYGSSGVNFNTKYDQILNKEVNLSDIKGNHSGQVGILQGVENANITITQSGTSGASAQAGSIYGTGSSGCSFNGELQRSSTKDHFDFYIKFGGSPCYMANQTLSGVITYDASTKYIRAAAVNSDRSNGVLFIGR